MALDPTKHADWEIAEDAESRMKTCYQLADEMGLTKDELLPHGNYVAKVDYMRVLQRLKDKPDGKFIEVTAITPTPLGEGKSTTTMGLLQDHEKECRKKADDAEGHSAGSALAEGRCESLRVGRSADAAS
jgi:formate--tetrahydrofolate ligase